MSFIDTSSFSLMTSLNNIRRNGDLERKWEERKQKGYSTEGLTERQKDNANFVSAYKEQQENNPEDKEMQTIMNKIYAGGKLTEKEMQYLMKKDPVLYQKMRNIEAEARQYEEDIKNCKTKDDVQRLKMKKIASSVSNIRSIENNPKITEEKKLAYIMCEKKRMGEIEKITQKFVEEGEYAALPTDAEKFQTEKELAEAQREELQNTDEKTEVSEEQKADGVQETDEVKTATIEEISEAVKTLVGKDEKNELKIGDNKRNETEIELSQEFRKIKNSKVKKAYVKAVMEFNVQN